MRGKYLVVTLAKNGDLCPGQNCTATSYEVEASALKQADAWAKQGYESYVYTLAAKIGMQEQPIILDRTVGVELEMK